jgi:hypothetical protein
LRFFESRLRFFILLTFWRFLRFGVLLQPLTLLGVLPPLAWRDPPVASAIRLLWRVQYIRLLIAHTTRVIAALDFTFCRFAVFPFFFLAF